MRIIEPLFSDRIQSKLVNTRSLDLVKAYASPHF